MATQLTLSQFDVPRSHEWQQEYADEKEYTADASGLAASIIRTL